MVAQAQIAARLQGDDYQARFFWYQAAQLLFSTPQVVLVKLENDDALHVDDVTVIYRDPGRREGAGYSAVDFFQIKFHVDQANAYSVDGMCDPKLAGSVTNSLLQRFFGTFLALRNAYPSFTLGLVSNWAWFGDDDLAKSIRQNGALPDSFFRAGPMSKLGKVRDKWRSHVETDDTTFCEFASRLRLKLNYFGLLDFNAALDDRLHRAGLVPINTTQDASRYDDLARKFIVAGTTEFDAAQLRSICEREGLIGVTPPSRNARRIGFRTFVPFAELIESETDVFVCGEDLFDGRHPRSDNAWSTLYERFSKFVTVQRSNLTSEHEILLDCHSTAALLAGYLLTTRAAAWPLGPRPFLHPQRPGVQDTTAEDCTWTAGSHCLGDDSDLAIAVSVTHRISSDVLDYVQHHGERVGRLIELVPSIGHGPHSVHGADHCLALIQSLIARIRDERVQGALSHLFISAPNFFTFFLGQHLRALGEVVVYEYDFDGPEPREYRAALRLPFHSESSKHEDVDNGT